MPLDGLAVLCCDGFAVGPRLLERGPACLAEQRLPRGPVAGLPEGFNVGCVTQVGQHGRQFPGFPQPRSEEHTSELQSLMRISYAVFCLKKKKYYKNKKT